MNRSNVHLLDLPNEILLTILRKLNNIDVLYSLLDINNGRLDIIAQEKTFTNILNFVHIDEISLIDRFCMYILPRINHNIKYFILEPNFMERILLAAVYPNLTELKLLNFEQQIASKYFTDESSLRSVFQQQITSLILVTNDKSARVGSSKEYTRNVYAYILNFFKKLTHLNIIGPYVMLCPGLSLRDLPSTTFYSSILTHLCIIVENFDDCLYLLDGRLKQLTTFNVNVYSIDTSSTIVHNTDMLPNLKCFSLKSYFRNQQYEKIPSLLRRMPYLEHLTLYLSIKGRNRIIDGTCVQDDILVHVPQLHSFTFYISTYIDIGDLSHNLSHEHIQQTLINIGQQNATSIINNLGTYIVECSIFSLPFSFDHLLYLGNIFPNIVFNYVTYLLVQDRDGFKHEFFVRIARSFPLLKYFRIYNIKPQVSTDPTLSSDHSQSYSMIEYPHLMSLDVAYSNQCYLEQFLNETKACVPCLTELAVSHYDLKIVTNNFTREETRRNCAKVKQLVPIQPLDNSQDFYHYFPSL
ncbi:unnamed protein product [Rotaria magnacalcarata]|uniref:F-box domain-containing protein n=3 Tax=Rotaria TaxID=231623 RepID=A0A816VN88_9BILA|nr:unnamed protein product [Rotaria magnacalcarata]CAF1592488.1 unnamed protein product [Rotaria magnacalcarata]CAF2108438.1 unnamed protein product [Rotaria magnacalcarata]CAF2127331.1 unnamed protein product [Rotaria magnacalcarata]CAF2192015.1 unnamed protein product [Rotaria magnacalcarata]